MNRERLSAQEMDQYRQARSQAAGVTAPPAREESLGAAGRCGDLVATLDFSGIGSSRATSAGGEHAAAGRWSEVNRALDHYGVEPRVERTPLTLWSKWLDGVTGILPSLKRRSQSRGQSRERRRLGWSLVEVAAAGAVGLALMMGGSARAANYTWDANGATPANPSDGSGNWDAGTANWWTGATNVVWPNLTADMAIFGSGGTAGIVTVSGTRNVGTITFNGGTTGSYTLTGGTLNGLGQINIGQTSPTSTTIASNITRAGGLALSSKDTTDASTLNLSGALNVTSIAFNPTYGAQATWTLSGTTPNVTGNLTIDSAQVPSMQTVVLAKTPGVNAVSGDISMGHYGGGGHLRLGASEQIPNTSTINVGAGGAYGNNASFSLMGFDETIGWLTQNSSRGANVVQNGGTANSVLTLAGNVTSKTAAAAGAGGSFTVRDGSTGTLSLVKTGTGTQVFGSTGLTHTGTTTINQGTLRLTSANISGSPITVNAGGTFALNGANWGISGAFIPLNLNGGTLLTDENAGYVTEGRAFNVTSSSTLQVNGTGTTGNNSQFFIDAGVGIASGQTLTLNTSLNNGIVLRGTAVNAGSLTVNGAGTTSSTGRANVQFSTAGAGNFANTDVTLTNATMNVGQGTNGDVNSAGATVKSLSGNGKVVSDTVAGTLTVGSNNGTGSFSGVLANGTSTLSLAKTGTGTQTLTGLSTYTGATTVNQGVLKLDLSTNTTGVLASTSPLTMGGGTLLVQGKNSGASSQTLGNLTLAASSSSVITVDPNGGTGTTLTLGNTWTANMGASVFFDLSAGTPATAKVTSNPALTNGIIGGWATVKDDTGTGLATVSGGNIVRYTGGTVLASNSDSATTNFTSTPTDPAYVSGTITMTAATHNVNTVAISTGAGGTMDLNGQTLAVATNGGVLVDGSGNYTIQNGGISGTNASLTKSGTGTLTVSSVNTYTGATNIYGGTLKLQAPATSLTGLASLVMRIDANDVTGSGNPANGSTITSWKNLAGAGSFTGTSAQFTPNANTMNGLPIVHFTGNGFTSPANYTAPVTIMYVGRMDGGANGRLVGSSNVNWLLGYHSGTQGDGYFLGWVHDSAQAVNYGGNLYEGLIPGSPSSSSVYQNGVLLASNTSGVTGPNTLTIGGGNGASASGEASFGSIGELLVFNTASLTAAQRLQAERYLQAKWQGVLPATTAVNISGGATLDLNGVNQQVGSLTGVAGSKVLLNGATLSTGMDNSSTTYLGTLEDGTVPGGDFTKNGTGNFVMGGSSSNTYTGATVLAAGQLGLSKTGGAFAVPGNFYGINNQSPDVYTTADNQFAPGAVMYFQGPEGDHVRFELLGTTQTLAGIDNSASPGRGVIQHKEQVGAASVDPLSTLVLNGSGSYFYDGYLRNNGGLLEVVKNGTGTQTLGGGNITYTGGTTLNGGVLNFAAANNAIGGVMLLNGGTLNQTGTGYLVQSGRLNVAVNSTINVTNSGASNQIFFDGGVTGAGNLIINNTGVTAVGVHFRNGTPGLFSGDLTVNGGHIATQGNGFNFQNSNVTLNNANWYMDGTQFATTGANEQVGSLNGNGNLLMGGFALSLGTFDKSGSFSGVISGSGPLTKTGTGTQSFSGANTYSGTTSVNKGVLNIQNSSALGTTANGTTVAAGAALELQHAVGIAVGAEALSLNGTGVGNNGALRNISGTNSWAGAITLAGNTEIQSDAGSLLISGNITNGANALTVDGAADTNLSGVLGGGAGGLTKIGGGTLSFTGANTNTYTGVTTASNGTLDLARTGGGNKSIAGDGVAGTDDLVINGGNVLISASEQIADAARVNMSSGSFMFNGTGLTETIGSFTNTGGVFSTNGANTLIGTGNTITWAGGTNTITAGGLVQDNDWVISGGTNTVNGGPAGTLQVQTGATGLHFSGTLTHGVTLDSHAASPGRILLQNDVFVDNAFLTGTAQILNGGAAAVPGTVDMDGGTRTFDVINGTNAVDMLISARLANGTLTKTGAGTLRLSGDNTYTGVSTVNAGTLELAAGALQNGSIDVNVGTFRQSGGTNNVTGSGTGNLTIAPGASYLLQGGTLNFGDYAAGGTAWAPADTSTITLDAGSQFSFTGGELHDVSNIIVTDGSAFTQQGGDFYVGQDGIGPAALTSVTNGGYSLLDGTLRLDVFGDDLSPEQCCDGVPSDNDQLTVAGTALLDSEISLNFVDYEAEFGDAFTLICADDIILGDGFSLVGGFFRLVPTTGDPNGPMALQAIVPEPASVAVWTLVGLAGAAGVWRSRKRIAGRR